MSRLNGLLQILTLRCEAAAELMSRELDEPLSRLERTALLCHLAACRSCRRFRSQVRRIRQALRLRDRAVAADADSGLSAEARARMVRVLREAQATGGSSADSRPDAPHDENLS
ncbi:MAG: zf-HC2 domain-containing protein [Isosphaeraceae bacterium]